MCNKPILGFGWVLSVDEFKELFPNYLDTHEYFYNIASTDTEIFFGSEIISLTGGKTANIAEILTNYLDSAAEVAENFTYVLRHNNVKSWDRESKWYRPQIYYLEVVAP